MANATNSAVIAPSHPPSTGPRLRAFLVGLPLLIATCFVSVYADMVSKYVQFGVLQIAPPAIVGLFALALLNAGARKRGRGFLSAADLLVIYVMLLLGVMVSTRGMVEKVIPALAYLPYYGKDTNGLPSYITRHMPAWAFPFTPSAATDIPWHIQRYYERLQPGETLPWSIWIGPLCAWAVLFALVALVFASLATLLRRRWVEEERLSFPLTRLPLALIQNEAEGQPFLQNRMLWAGFIVPVIVFGMNGLHANIPNFPGFTLDFDLTSTVFTDRPWSGMDGIRLWLSLAAVGFGFFLPGDLLFSLWFFFLLTRAQDLVATALNYETQSIGTHNARIWTGYQAAGAYLVLIAAQIRFGWPGFVRAWRTAFGPPLPPAQRLDDRNDLLTSRGAFLGLFVGFAGIVAWLTLAGMSPGLAAFQMGLYLFVITVVMARSVSEAGIIMTETSFLPSHLLGLVTPLATLGGQNVSLLSLTDITFTRDLRGNLLSPFMDAQKMASEIGMRQRSLLLPLALAIGIAAVVAAFFFLYFSYTMGHVTLYTYPNGNAGNMFGRGVSFLRGGARPPDATAYTGLGVGVLVTLALTWLRATVPGFPLNPLAYAVAPTWTMYCFAFPFFIAWLLKTIFLRWGGIGMYRRWSPFMLGMILGEFSMAIFWAVMSTPAIGWNAPMFPWP